jgi:hypothetical protein
MIESLHFHRGYSLRLRKSKPLISYGIISSQSVERLTRRLEQLGYAVHLEPRPVAA